MTKIFGLFLFLPAILILVPGSAFSRTWENAVGTEFASVTSQIKTERAAWTLSAQTFVPATSEAERDEAAKKVLALTKKFDDLIGAAVKKGEKIDSRKVLELAADSGLLSKENNDAFERFSEIVARENREEIEAEAASLGLSLDAYRDSAKTPIWSAFMQKIADAKSKVHQLSPERNFAQYLKYENRLALQRGRFVADNQFEAEAALGRLKAEIFDTLGLTHLPR